MGSSSRKGCQVAFRPTHPRFSGQPIPQSNLHRTSRNDAGLRARGQQAKCPNRTILYRRPSQCRRDRAGVWLCLTNCGTVSLLVSSHRKGLFRCRFFRRDPAITLFRTIPMSTTNEASTRDEVRPLVLYEDYTRQDVHDIFDPHSPFTPQAGTWGLQGIIELPGRTEDFVFFVTFGQKQGEHEFDEGITTEGIFRWQSQPRQDQKDARVRRLITHDPDRNSIHLFLRTADGRRGETVPYTYLGRLRWPRSRARATSSFPLGIA
jgi:Domain of unknown function (DUF3427)